MIKSSVQEKPLGPALLARTRPSYCEWTIRWRQETRSLRAIGTLRIPVAPKLECDCRFSSGRFEILSFKLKEFMSPWFWPWFNQFRLQLSRFLKLQAFLGSLCNTLQKFDITPNLNRCRITKAENTVQECLVTPTYGCWMMLWKRVSVNEFYIYRETTDLSSFHFC